MTQKGLFLDTCQKIISGLAQSDFKTLEKGQRLRKLSKNKDLAFEIYFQSSFRNTKNEITLIPHVAIFSKKVKKWKIPLTHNKHENGCIFAENIGYISSIKKWGTWNVTLKNQANITKKIIKLVQKHALPLFELFDDQKAALRTLTRKGSSFCPGIMNTLFPLDFVLVHGTKNDAQNFFAKTVHRAQNRTRINEFFASLSSKGKLDLNYSEFHQANQLKVAYVYGLKLLTKKD